jgi:hypothetical protein
MAAVTEAASHTPLAETDEAQVPAAVAASLANEPIATPVSRKSASQRGQIFTYGIRSARMLKMTVPA